MLCALLCCNGNGTARIALHSVGDVMNLMSEYLRYLTRYRVQCRL